MTAGMAEPSRLPTLGSSTFTRRSTSSESSRIGVDVLDVDLARDQLDQALGREGAAIAVAGQREPSRARAAGAS